MSVEILTAIENSILNLANKYKLLTEDSNITYESMKNYEAELQNLISRYNEITGIKNYSTSQQIEETLSQMVTSYNDLLTKIDEVGTSSSGGTTSSLTNEQLEAIDLVIANKDNIENSSSSGVLFDHVHIVTSLEDGSQSRLSIQAELNKGGTIIIKDAGTYLIDSPLEFGNNTTLHLYDGVEIKNTVSDYMAINKDIINGNSNIYLIGGHYDCDNMSATGAYPDLYPGHAIFFHNINNLRYLDLKVSRAQKYAFLSVDIDGFMAKNIILDTDSDGLHFQSPIKNAIIENIKGRTEDDLLAFTLGDYIAYQVTNEGDFENISMVNIYPENAKAVLKIIGSGVDSLYKFKNFTLDNVYGSCYSAPIAIVDGAGLGADLINTRVENLKISNINVITPYAHIVEYTATGGGDVKFSNIRAIDKKLINFHSSAVLDTLTIDGVDKDSSLVVNSKTFMSFDGFLDTLNVNNIDIKLNASTLFTLDGTINKLNFSNIVGVGSAQSSDKIFNVGSDAVLGKIKCTNIVSDNVKYFVSALTDVTFLLNNIEFKNNSFTGTLFYSSSLSDTMCRIIGSNIESEDSLTFYTSNLGTISIDCKSADISNLSKLSPLGGDIVTNSDLVKIFKDNSWISL